MTRKPRDGTLTPLSAGHKEEPAVGWTNDDIMRAANRGVYEALKRHKERGESVVVWEDGKVVWLTSDQIDLSWYENLPEHEK